MSSVPAATVPLGASLFAAGCACAPEIVVDRATALEQRAAGSFADLEKELAAQNKGKVCGG